MSISSGLAFLKINESRLKYPHSSPANASTAAAARSSDENLMLMNEDENQSAYNPDHEDIPREIPLNQEQEDGLLKRIWNAFSEVYKAAKNFGHRILRFFTRRGNSKVN